MQPVDEPNTRRVLVLTMHTEDEHLVALLEAGAGGTCSESVADRELVDAVRTVAAGDVYVQPSAARALARGLAKREGHAEERARFEKLTDREQVVLKMVAEGYTRRRSASISPFRPRRSTRTSSASARSWGSRIAPTT